MAISAEPADAVSLISASKLDTERASTGIGHIGALDGMRGIAILLVLFYHFGGSASYLGINNNLVWLTGIGWCGVDMFFVLSGFLITGILHDTKGKGRYFKNFYARRTLRIFPLYYMAVSLVIVLSMIWPAAAVLGETNPVWFLLYLSNFAIAIEGGGTIIDHFWSLAIEEQFYLIWPLLVFMLSRRQLMALAAAMVVMALLVRLVLVAYGAPGLSTYVFTPARMDALAVGALIALAIRGPHGIAPFASWAWITGIASGALFVIMVWRIGTFSSFHPLMLTIGLTLLSIGFGSMLILTLTSEPISYVLNLGVLRWLGTYSYGLYVWHPIVTIIVAQSPLTVVFGQSSPGKTSALLALAACLSILATMLSYKLLESPFLRMKHRFA